MQSCQTCGTTSPDVETIQGIDHCHRFTTTRCRDAAACYERQPPLTCRNCRYRGPGLIRLLGYLRPLDSTRTTITRCEDFGDCLDRELADIGTELRREKAQRRKARRQVRQLPQAA